jgi:triacylglycerol lipase
MYKKIRYAFILAIILISFPYSNLAYGNKNDAIAFTPCELLMLCHQSINLYYNGRNFVLPTYPEKHSLVTILRGPKEEDLLGFISETPTRIFVVFRGTQSMRDLKRDLNCVRVPFHLVPNGGCVHQGFLSTYTKVGEGRVLSLREFILRTISGLDSSKKLYITGHSMGAALATLCALDIAKNSPFHQPILYTFASPRVGNRTFANTFNSTINTCVRIENQYDYIPRIPLISMGYFHVKGGVVIRVKTNSLENHHRLITAYFPGIVANFTNLVQELLQFNPAGLIPPLPIRLPQPSWTEKNRK